MKVDVYGYPEPGWNKAYGSKATVTVYHRTHILSDKVGGKWIPANLFPGYAKMNLSGMKRCENKMIAQLKKGVPVLYSGQVRNSDGPRPDGIQMTAYTPVGELFSVYVRNVAVTQATC